MDDRKQEFIKELAEYLVGDEAKRSIQLSMGNKEAEQWAKIRNTTPLFGYMTVEEATKELTDFLK